MKRLLVRAIPRNAPEHSHLSLPQVDAHRGERLQQRVEVFFRGVVMSAVRLHELERPLIAPEPTRGLGRPARQEARVLEAALLFLRGREGSVI